MNKLSNPTSFFYLDNPTFKAYRKELESLVNLYNSAEPFDKPTIEQMIENCNFSIKRKAAEWLSFELTVEVANWQSEFIMDCKEFGI